MADNKSFKKLPEIFQTPTQKRFFDATFEQVFSARNSEKVNGFIGRRDPGYYDPFNDFYLNQPTKDRTWNMLESMAVSKDDSTLESSNEMFYEDLINRINFLQGNTGNHDRMFSGEYYSFAPPIDMDKFINFHAYYWAPTLPAIEIIGVLDAEIEADIIGALEYTYTKPDLETIDFTSGLKVIFVDSINYNTDLIVGGVGKGIYLTDSHTATDADYITIERGSPDGNTWSRTNSWFHKDIVVLTALETGMDAFADASVGRRPIIEFVRDLELFNAGTQFLSDVNLAATVETFGQINQYNWVDGLVTDEYTNIAPPSIDGKVVEDGDLIIFTLDDSTTYPINGSNTFTAVLPPYEFVLDIPFSDTDNIYALVKRPIVEKPDPNDSGTWVLLGYDVFYDPQWYTVEDQINMVSFTVETDGTTQDDIYSEQGDGIQVAYVAPLVYVASGDVSTVDVRINNVPQIANIDYVYAVFPANVTVTFVTPPAITDLVEIVVGDGNNVKGLIDGVNLEPIEQDIVTVYVNNQIATQEVAGNGGTVFAFNTLITDVNYPNVFGITFNDTNPADGTASSGVVYDVAYNSAGVLQDPAGLVASVTFIGTTVTVTTNYPLASTTTDTVVLTYGEPPVIEVDVKDYIWQSWTQTNYELVTDTNTTLTSIEPVLTQVLVPYPNLATPAVTGDTVFVLEGVANISKTYYYNGDTWVESTNSKTSINQAPLFTLYYTELDSLGNEIPLEDFNGSTFAGSEIFSYKINTTDSTVDPFLGFAVEYKNLGQTADIVFEHDLETDRYRYLLNGELTEIKGYYYYKKTNPDSAGALSPTFEHTWHPHDGDTEQRVIDRWAIQVDDQEHFPLSVIPEALPGGLFDVIADLQGDILTQGPDPLGAPGPFTFDFYVVLDGGLPTKAIKLTDQVTSVPDQAIALSSYTKDSLDPDARGYWSPAAQLENNPNYEEVLEYTSNELTQHFISIMKGQDGFEGDPLSSKNNYRDTAEDLSQGTFILQTADSLLKSMFVISEEWLDVILALRFSRQEYTRYKDKLVKAARQLIREGYTGDDNSELLPAENVFNEAINRIASTSEYFDAFTMSYMFGWGAAFTSESFSSAANPVVDTSTIALDGTMTLGFDIDLDNPKNGVLLFITDGINDVLLAVNNEYIITGTNTIQLQNYVDATFTEEVVVRYYEDPIASLTPSTPSKIGCYPVFEPTLILDESYVDPTYMIIGHDGSKTPTYTEDSVLAAIIANTLGVENLDLRDSQLLEFETRIYNHLEPKFRDPDYDLLFRHEDIRPGAFRDVNYSLEEYSEIFRSNFLKWASRIQANFKSHLEYDELDWMTWNYRPANPELPGHWKGIYRYYYDTISPGDTPWAMLGFSQQPEWWVTMYGTNYSNANVAMWNDIAAGYIADGAREGVDERFVRTGMVIPVDASALNIAPHLLGLVIEPAGSQKDAEWIYGDNSPVEEAWINSSDYAFVVMENQYLMRPGEFGERYWNPLDIYEAPINTEQLVSETTYKRRSNSTYVVHGETVNGETVINYGYQRFITDRLLFLGKEATPDFGAFLRNLDVKLGHRYAGYTNKETLRVFTEGTSTDSSNANLLIPDENINVKVHKGKTIREYVYSGVVIIINDNNKFEVNGYDLLDPMFTMIPRKQGARVQQITVGGEPAEFKHWATDTTYLRGEYVQYNTQFYQSNVDQTTSKFSDGDWARLKNLPSVDGVSVSYNATADTTQSIPVEYNTEFDTIQDVFDFLIGYGDFLESEGWVFDNVDTDINVIEDWLASAKDFMFWANTNWAPGNTLFLSPGAHLIKLDVAQGYPDNIERISNGVYSILDENGFAIPPADTLVDRDRQHIEVSHKNSTIGIYGLRVSAKETEHIFIFDNTTVFNDTIYDPLLMSRQRRLKVNGYRTLDWYGKFEADGYLIQDNKLIQNYENLTSSFRDYYNSEVPLDNPVIEDTARHLIGYQNRDYLENLRLFDDTQYLFYKGMIPEKGSIQPVEKILRSDFIQGSKNIEIYEEWAFKIADFGATNDNVFIEFLIEDDQLRSDPQIVQLVYPQGPVNTKSVKAIVVTNAEEIYTDQPIVQIIPQSGDIPTTEAKAVAVLGTDGRIASITVIDTGSNYAVDPLVVILRQPGSTTNDTAFAVTRFDVAIDDPRDDRIVIDVDDTERWLTRPFGRRYDDFIPTIDYADVSSPILNAGYAHLNDIDFTAFRKSDIPALWEDVLRDAPALGQYIWVANAIEDDLGWNMYELVEIIPADPLDMADNLMPGYFAKDGELFTYLPIDATDTSDITDITTQDGRGVIVPLFDFTGTIKFVTARASTVTLDGTGIPTPALTSPKVWVDNLNGTGNWAFIHDINDGNNYQVIRQEELLINSGLFNNAFVYEKETSKTLVNLPIYDPFKGFIPGIADRNLTYKADRDPARYTVASNPMLINDNLAFNDRQVGELWWDLSTSRYTYYEQGTLEYRRDNWGLLFPGSSVDIYEWTRSTVIPEDYVTAGFEGTPRNTTDYVVRTEYNSFFSSNETVYYFWVTRTTSVPNNIARRTMSTIDVARIINNPRNQGYAWLSFIHPNAYVFNNINYLMADRETIIQINYRFTETENPKHTEWTLIGEGSPSTTGDIPDKFWDKMVDSLVQYDAEGRYVPDPRLSEFERYGTRERPRQTWFVDVMEARKILVENANPNLVTINLRDDPSWDDSLLTTNNYWEYRDWYEEGYDATNTIPIVKVPSGRPSGSAGAPLPPALTPEQEAKLSEGDVVKVVETNNSAYYVWDGTVLSTLVRREKTAFQIKDALYTDSNLTALSTELREILAAIHDQIFINDYDVMLNLLYFAMINYVVFEQDQVDWFFKTTYIQILQEGQNLGLQPKTYVPDSFDSFVDYINEVKPYQTKVRDYSISIGGYIDEVGGTAWDMDQVMYETEPTVPGSTEYIDPADYPFDPLEIQRQIKTFAIHDSVQCGFRDKEYILELGRINLSGNGVQTVFTSTEIESATKIIINGRVLDKTEYATSEDIDDETLIITFNVAPPAGTDNILVISKVAFTHNALEEMRLMFNAPRQQFPGNPNPADIKIVNFDLEVTHDGQLQSGWGASPWDVTFGWNIPGFSTQDAPGNIKPFIVYSGAANRFLAEQKDLTPEIYKFAVNAGVINYSSYVTFKGANTPTTGELAALQEVNTRYAGTFGCNYQGIYLDAREFTFAPTYPWDNEGWDISAWDRQIPMPIVDPSVPASQKIAYNYVGDGVRRFTIINYEATIDSVTVAGAPLATPADYIVTSDASSTTIEFVTPPPLGDEVVVVYNHVNDDNFDFMPFVLDEDGNRVINPDNGFPIPNVIVDGGLFVPQAYDSGVTAELALYNVTENVVINSDTNTRVETESFIGTGAQTEFILTQNNGLGVTIISVTPDQGAYTMGITGLGEYAITFAVAPLAAVEFEVEYRIGSLRQYYVADDAIHYDVPGDSTIFVNGILTNVDMITPAGFGTHPFDAEPTYTSRYILPTPFAANADVYVVQDSGGGVTGFTNKVDPADYDLMTMADYLTWTGFVNPQLAEHKLDLRTQYRTYIGNFYPSVPMQNTDSYVFTANSHFFTENVTVEAVIDIEVDGFIYSKAAYTIVANELVFTAIPFYPVPVPGQAIDAYYDTESFMNTFNDSSVVRFITEQHMAVITGLGAETSPNPQKVLFDYALNPVSHRVHLSEMDVRYDYRNSDAHSTTIAVEVLETDKQITVANASVLPSASPSYPGVAWIGGEKFTYISVSGNTLKGITRHIQGTSVDGRWETPAAPDVVDTSYPVGTKVISGGDDQLIPNPSNIPWVNSLGGLAMSTTEQALFLQAEPGSGTGSP